MTAQPRTLVALLLVELVVFGCSCHAAADDGGGKDCPCDTEQQCLPVKTFPDKEVLGFMVSRDNWRLYDWSKITTLALFTEMTSQELTQLVCYAHSKNVRVVLHGDYPIADLSDEDKRSKWVMGFVDQVKENYLDGLNIDIESAVAKDSTNASYLTQLVKETYSTFKSLDSSYQVTFDVAWSPNGIDSRWYEYKSLSLYSDFLVVMAYDERSQIWTGPCVAGANSAYPATIAGVKGYLELGIPASKLALGLPWYGYDYPCLTLSKDVCSIQLVPFRGAPCSDAAGTQHDFDEILLRLANSTSGRLYDDVADSPYFMYKATDGSNHQVWYDDPSSLSIKYGYAKSEGLRGLAFWNVDTLNYTEVAHRLPEPTVKMWQAIDTFV